MRSEMSCEPIRSLSDLLAFKSSCYPAMRGEIEALDEALAICGSQDSDSTPCVAFVGRYSTGKSFLINALVGKKVVSTTSGQESRCIVRIIDGEDSAFEVLGETKVPVSLEEFESDTSFRGQLDADPSSEAGEAPRFFERATPAKFLRSVWLLDTPGLDGREGGAFVNARKGVQTAAKLAAACCVVLPARTLGYEEQDCLAEVTKRCPNISLICNMSDELDEDEVEEVRKSAKRALCNCGLVGRVFVVSALWQVSAAADRQRIRDRRSRKDYEPAEPINEWEELRSFLAEVAREDYLKRGQRKLDAIEVARQMANRVQEVYSQILQAEHALPGAAPTLRKKMVPPMGEAFLDLALKAVEEGKPIPWALLKNVGVSLESLAPQMLLGQGLLLEIENVYSSLMTELCREAGRKLDQRLLRLVKVHLQGFDASQFTGARNELRFAEWQSGTSADEFTYDGSLAVLANRWASDPELMERETALCIDPLREFVAALSA